MKSKIFLIILLICCLSQLLFSQNQLKKPFVYNAITGKYETDDTVVTNYLLDLNYMDYIDSLLIEKKKQIADYDKILKNKDSIIALRQSQIADCDSSVAKKDVLIKKLTQPVEINVPSPFIEWEGFYGNVIASYTFDSQDITKPIPSVLKYGISAEFGFKVLGKLRLGLEPIIPFNDKLRIQFKVGYKLF